MQTHTVFPRYMMYDPNSDRMCMLTNMADSTQMDKEDTRFEKKKIINNKNENL